jgi:hypothetical protein
MKILITIGLSFMLLGCDEQTRIETSFVYPAVSPTLAVFCILTPGDSIQAWVLPLQAIPDQPLKAIDYVRVSDATVSLQSSQTTQALLIPYTGYGGYYSISQRNIPVKAGLTYRLRVTRPGFASIEAICKVPSRAAVIEQFNYGSSYNTGSYLNGGSGIRRRYEARWQDVSSINDSTNYFFGAKYLFSTSLLNPTSQIDTAKSIYFSENIAKVGATYFYQGETNDNSAKRFYYLFTVTPELFKFYKTLEDRRYNGTNFFGGYRGIIPDYTNIKGDYGVFGGYLSSSIEVTFK